MRNVTILAACLFTVPVSAAESNGEYIARILDYVACHTAEGGAVMAGGRKFPTPAGDTYSANITPGKAQDIENYSYEDFERAVRQRVAESGHPLYPTMPYPSYVKLSDEDVKALYSYFIHDVIPSAQPNKENAISRLLPARWPPHIQNWLSTDAPVMAVEGAKTDGNVVLVEQGVYLVEGPGHCGSCHTPRGMAMNEKICTNTDAEYLNGMMIDGRYTPPLRGTSMSEQELKSLLLTGKNKHTAISGSMTETVTQSTQYLTDEDATAITQYLLSLKSVRLETVHVAATTAPWSNSPEAGKVTYNRYCSICHGLEGKNTDDNAPSLANSLLMMADDPTPLLRVITHGAGTPTIRGSVPFKMPTYGSLLSDNEIHDVINYVRKNWDEGNGEASQEGLAGAKKALYRTVCRRRCLHRCPMVLTRCLP